MQASSIFCAYTNNTFIKLTLNLICFLLFIITTMLDLSVIVA